MKAASDASFPGHGSLLEIAGITGVVMPIERNAEIFGQGEPAEYIYKITSGAVRTYRLLCDGRRQIDAFYLAGDMFGLELSDMHSYSCEAVTGAKIVFFQRSAILAAAQRDGEVARQLWELTARHLRRSQDHTLLLVKSSQERVASFLLEMARRLRETSTVELPMPRQDIADYLGLTIETVSRTLTQFEEQSTIEFLAARRIALLNPTLLKQLNS